MGVGVRVDVSGSDKKASTWTVRLLYFHCSCIGVESRYGDREFVPELPVCW